MICEVCRKNAATVHVTKVVNNVRTELHLCQQCARERGELQDNTRSALCGICNGSYIGNGRTMENNSENQEDKVKDVYKRQPLSSSKMPVFLRR